MNNSKYRIIVAVILVILLVSVLVSACNGIGDLAALTGSAANIAAPTESNIITPNQQTKTLVGSPIQVQSQFTVTEISRVELWVNGKQQRADIPNNGRITQQWIPNTAGSYPIEVVAKDINNGDLHRLTTTIEVVDNVVAEAVMQPAAPPNMPTATPVVGQGASEAAAFSPQQQCEFGQPNAPNLKSLVIGSADVANNPDTVVTISGSQDLITDWVIDNADSVNIFVKGQASSERITALSASGTQNIQADDPGLYEITINARNGECSVTTNRVVQVGTIAGNTPTPFIPTPTPTIPPPPTATPYYPPPPPYPGVPPGPTQKQLPELRPPVCDAADLLGVYVPPTSQRIDISELDDIPAKTVGGSTVFRAWKLQNTGTCTWGPGYELAFYGGRSMGSGGVAFESTWPGEPGRRNLIVDQNRLIVPEGLPNQVSNVEILLNAPVTPGIHQSYWRMRNPQGVYFGPIMGVTLEVVRTCEPGIYGAPTINKFEPIIIGNVYKPANPVNATGYWGDQVEVEWNVANATNIDIVSTGPTGNVTTLSTGNLVDRATIRLDTLGLQTFTLYADNGPCTVQQEFYIEVVPPPDNPAFFELTVAPSGVDASKIDVRWNHADPKVDQIELVAQRYDKTQSKSCWLGICQQTTGAVAASSTANDRLPQEIAAISNGDASSDDINSSAWKGIKIESGGTIIWDYAPPISTEGHTEFIARGSRTNSVVKWSGASEGGVSIVNIPWGLCPTIYPPVDDRLDDTVIRFTARATINGESASPEFSKVDDLTCRQLLRLLEGKNGENPVAVQPLPTQLPTEIQSSSTWSLDWFK